MSAASYVRSLVFCAAQPSCESIRDSHGAAHELRHDTFEFAMRSRHIDRCQAAFAPPQLLYVGRSGSASKGLWSAATLAPPLASQQLQRGGFPGMASLGGGAPGDSDPDELPLGDEVMVATGRSDVQGPCKGGAWIVMLLVAQEFGLAIADDRRH